MALVREKATNEVVEARQAAEPTINARSEGDGLPLEPNNAPDAEYEVWIGGKWVSVTTAEFRRLYTPVTRSDMKELTELPTVIDEGDTVEADEQPEEEPAEEAQGGNTILNAVRGIFTSGDVEVEISSTCTTVKGDGEVCGRDLPCQYHPEE